MRSQTKIGAVIAQQPSGSFLKKSATYTGSFASHPVR